MKLQYIKTLALATALLSTFIAGPAQAQTKLKWAHVYEVSEPYHNWRSGPRTSSASAPTAATPSRCSPPRRSARKATSTRA